MFLFSNIIKVIKVKELDVQNDTGMCYLKILIIIVSFKG